MQIIVAANGCTDRTVEYARAAAPKATVLDLAEASKTAAINAGNAIAMHYPRIFLDADVECDYAALAALADAAREAGVMTAAPAIRIDLSRAGPMVRAYYRVWQQQPYAREGKGGAGCYALSQAALETVGEFPPVIADDIWIHTRFADADRRFVTQGADGRPVFSTVHPPRTMGELIRVEARKQVGNRMLRAKDAQAGNVKSGGTGGVASAFRGGARLSDIAVFTLAKLAARMLASWRIMRGNGGIWSRDQSSRRP